MWWFSDNDRIDLPTVIDNGPYVGPEPRRWPGTTNWGYLRIAGECRKLGVSVSATSVTNILRRHRLGPAPRHRAGVGSEVVAQAKALVERS
jgi:hypothetical protein